VTTGTKIFLIILLVIGLGVGGFFGIRYLARESELGPFNDHITEYLSAADPGAANPVVPNPPGAGQPANQGAYIKGKVIPVDVKSKSVDWLFYDLPPKLQPAAPAEVGTVVWLEWDQRQVGQYGTGGGGAYVQTCRVTVIDKAERRVLSQTVFEGGPPPRTSRRGSSASGPKPTDRVIQYLQSLPTR
jgi:hypothetical protein